MIDWFLALVGANGVNTVTPVEAALVFVTGSGVVLLFVSGGLSTLALAMRGTARRRSRERHDRAERWKGALHSILYDGAEPDTLWQHVTPPEAFDFLHFLVQYARRLEGDERQRVCDLAEPYLPRILPFLSRRSDARRARAVQMLGELGLPEYAPTLIAALSDRSSMVAMVAASTLARTESPEYVEEVLGHLDRFPHWRQDFLGTLVASMGEDAAPALRSTLLNPAATVKVRCVAADALSMLSDPKAADPAAEVIAATTDVELSASTLRILASVGSERHLPVVRAALDAPALPIRLAAIRALGRFGVTADLPALERALRHDPSPWVAIAAARALKESGAKGVLEALAGSEHPRAALGLQVISEARTW